MKHKSNCTCNVCDCNIVHEESVKQVLQIMPNSDLLIKLTNFFKIMGDFTRLKIMWALEEQELCVGDIANVLNMTKSSISHQLSTLKKASIVKSRKQGKTVYYSLDDKHIKQIFLMGCEHINEPI